MGMIFSGAISFVIITSLIKSGAIKLCDEKVKKYIKNLENKIDEQTKVNDNLHIEYCSLEKELKTNHVQYNLLKKQSRDALKEDRQLFAEIIKRIE